MDEKTRNDLGVVTGQTYHFRIERVRVGRLRWALDSSNPAHYIAAWLAVISAALSILGFVVGGALALLR